MVSQPRKRPISAHTHIYLFTKGGRREELTAHWIGRQVVQIIGTPTCWILYTSVVTLLSERQNTDWDSAESFHKDDSGLLQAATLWKT